MRLGDFPSGKSPCYPTIANSAIDYIHMYMYIVNTVHASQYLFLRTSLTEVPVVEAELG